MTDQPPVRVLVTYGTRNGSTASIAEIIGSTLRRDGVDADVRSAEQVRSVTGYDAVVLGAALYTGRWHRHARRFARRYGKALRGCPVWLFSSGPLDESADARDIPPVPQAGAAASYLNAREHVTFHGRLTENAKGFVARSMVRNGRGGDFRNPDRIRAWGRLHRGGVA
jgi:menaquinone-dependent protoporphyrinogen oxidase